MNSPEALLHSGEGIPTLYLDRTYRSRLEARWAAFFDLVGWRYEYEPFDLNGWIPDFSLFGKSEEIIVEVKPFSRFGEYDIGKLERAIAGTSKVGRDILLLGDSIWQTQYPMLGWLGEWGEWPEPGYAWGPAPFSTVGGFGFCHGDMDYRNRMTGEHDGNFGNPDYEDIRRTWHHAGDVVQWRRRYAS